MFPSAPTILLDGLVILTAIVVRKILLEVIHWATPAETYTWAGRRLEWIGDVGIVSAVGIFTAFDLLKRVLIGLKTLMRSARSTPQDLKR